VEYYIVGQAMLLFVRERNEFSKGAVVRVYYGGRNVMMHRGANGPLPFDLIKGCPTRYLNDV